MKKLIIKIPITTVREIEIDIDSFSEKDIQEMRQAGHKIEDR